MGGPELSELPSFGELTGCRRKNLGTVHLGKAHGKVFGKGFLGKAHGKMFGKVFGKVLGRCLVKIFREAVLGHHPWAAFRGSILGRCFGEEFWGRRFGHGLRHLAGSSPDLAGG